MSKTPTYIRTIIITIVISLASIFNAVAKDAGDISAWMDNYIGQALINEPAAGVTILVGKGDDIVFTKAYGYSDLENKIPSKVETVYQIGSMTKQFTAVALLQLEEQGKLSLNDDITKYLPDYPTHGKKITIANILYHTSGIKNYIAVGYTDSRVAPGRIVNDAEYRMDLRPDEMIGFFKNEPLEFPPGTAWNYTNAGYYLAGLIIEKASGMSYSEYVENKLFAPSLMTSSYYTNFEKIISNRARGYKPKDGKLFNANAMSMTVPYAAGALSSTVEDLFKWNRIIHAGNQLLSKESYAKFITPGKLNNGQDLPISYALGIASAKRGGHMTIMHPGGINGFSSVLTYFPEQELSVIVLTNTYNKKSKSFADKVELALSAFLFDADKTDFDYR